MENLYFWEENYNNYINQDNIIGSGFESHVHLLNEDEVVKILVGVFQRKRVLKNIKKIASYEDLEKYITFPTALVFLDMHFIGYKMDYAGVNLVDYFSSIDVSTMPFNDKIKILNDIKKCLEKMHDFDIIHSDLQFKNVLYNDKNNSIKIGDINSSKTGRFHNGLLNVMTDYFINYYGYVKEIDIMSFNVMCDYLLNYDKKIFDLFLKKGSDYYFDYMKEDLLNETFEKDVYDEQISLIKHPVKHEKKDVKNVKYLIDYIR